MASSSTEQKQEQELVVEVQVEVEVVWTEGEDKQRVDEEAQEECNIAKSETKGTHTLTDASFLDHQESTCRHKESECLASSVFIENTGHQQLNDSSPGHGASEADVNDNSKVLGCGEEDKVTDSVRLNQEQGHSDLEVSGKYQEPEQQQGNQENQEDTTNSKNVENQESQSLEQCEQDRAVPIIMVTNLEEGQESAERQAADFTAESEKQVGMMPADASPAASLGDFPDFSGSDLQSLKSDTLSLLSETAISGKSDEQEGPEEDAKSMTASSIMEGLEEDARSVTTSSVMEGPEDDTRSVTASSVMSLFQRMQMDPLEREWLRCAALGNAPGLRQLLLQDPSLAPKKTALHWAAKQGRIETVDMMARSGADVNQRAGYTPLHLASLHGHAHIIQLLINNYNAKVNIRDYHGKMAAHYWNGSMDVFNTAASQSGGKWSKGRRGQRYGQLSALLSRSWSQGSLNVDLVPGSLELTPRLLPRSETNMQTVMDTF